MRVKLSYFLLAGVLLSVAVVQPVAVFAQGEDITLTVDATISSVLHKSQETTKAEQLRELYRSQIEVYRTSEQQYKIAKEQYVRLQTLAALEEAVRATREALLNRSRVLVTYIQLLKTTLLDVTGIDIAQKNTSLTRLKDLETKLLAQQDAILGSSDRQQIAAQADEFALMEEELEAGTYLATSLIAIGKVQTIYDQALLVHADIEQYHETATASSLVQAARQRAHEETDRNFAALQVELRELTDLIAEQSDEADKFTKVSHSRALKDLEEPYLYLSQLVGYLRELLRL